MKQFIFSCVYFFLTSFIIGQSTNVKGESTPEFLSNIASINSLLNIYATLSPFSDQANRFERIDSVQHEITTKLIRVLRDKQILNYQIEELFTNPELSISKSPDKRIYFFSLDEKTGGSFRSNKTIIYYQALNNDLIAHLYGNDKLDLRASSSYGDIHLIDSLTHQYIVIGGVTTCNTCLFKFAMTLKLDSTSIQHNVVTYYDGRTGYLDELSYHPGAKEIIYSYTKPGNDDSLYSDDEYIEGFEHSVKHLFKFINGEFIHVEACEYYNLSK